MITAEDRARITDLALKALDEIVERYGEDVTLEDALLIWEVSYPDGEHEGERCAEINARSTSHRSVIAGGLATVYANSQIGPWARGDE